MAKVKIKYEYNNKTGKRVIDIDYQSDPDSLAYEHENEHKKIVSELIGKGILSKKDAEDVVINRGEQKTEHKSEIDTEYIPQNRNTKEQ